MKLCFQREKEVEMNVDVCVDFFMLEEEDISNLKTQNINILGDDGRNVYRHKMKPI
jgi:hypothetical protein